MKKLLMGIALAVTVCTAKAACVDWSVSGTSDQVGTTVYLLTSIAGNYESVDALANAAVSSADIASLGRGKYGTPTTTANHSSITSGADFYYAIVDADGQGFSYVAANMSGSVYDPQNQETSKGTFTDVSTASILASESRGAIAAPEPTSGLLLLLGMAGLALKRKRA